MDRSALPALERLRRGPANTLELQRDLPTTHIAKAIYDLRQAGHRITTTRLGNGVALYTLTGSPAAVGHTGTTPSEPTPTASRAPVFGDIQLIRAMRR